MIRRGTTIFFLVTLIASSAQAENVESLADALNNLSPEQQAELTSGLTGMATSIPELPPVITTDLIEQAVEQGILTEAQASNQAEALAIIESNQHHFDFDVFETLGTAVDQGTLTEENALQLLNAFNSLSDAGKQLVGQQAFGTEDGNALYQQLSESDRGIIDSVSQQIGESQGQ